MSKIKVTKQQRANAIEALKVMWPSVPPDNVFPGLITSRDDYNENWDVPPTCGTLACFGGWCEWWPAFKEQAAPYTTADRLFGERTLFKVRRANETGTDHEVVTKRLRKLIRNSVIV